MTKWLAQNAGTITVWCAAICTFAIYSILYRENKYYRLFEHIFIGLATGYGVYITWSEVLASKWWSPMVADGHWYWAFAAVIGSMFYFSYSKRYVWISRLIFGFFMGLSAGGMFREFYEIYFQQMGSSMKPLAGNGMSIWDSLNVVVFYVILLCSMAYFFFSFEHKSSILKNSSSAGRWFLMIGFGAIFGATVMGRMTLFIGRFNFLVNRWSPAVSNAWADSYGKIALIVVSIVLITVITKSLINNKKQKTV